MYRKHGSYMCRALLRIFAEFCREYFQNFVGNISTLLKFVRKISTHGARYKTSYDCAGTIPTNVGIISTNVGIILTHVRTIPTLYIMCIGTNSTMHHTKFLNVALHV